MPNKRTGRKVAMTGHRANRPCPTKGATRRTRAEIAEIRDAIVDIVEADPPMTVRQVFYQLVARNIIEKTEEEYHGTVIRLMTKMRLDGTLPFDRVIDETRHARITQTFDNVTDAIDHTARFYRRNALAQADHYVEIWLEKDALAGVLWDAVSGYDVPLMVSRGMPSLTFLYTSACAIKCAAIAGKLTFIYQFGDHDPSGVVISKTIERRLNQLCQRLDCPPPIVERTALTEAQIAEFALPTRPTKRRGNSHAHKFIGDSVELDALPAGDLRDMIRAVIEQHVSPEATEALRVAEESERELLRAWRT